MKENKIQFEWNEKKDDENLTKHGIDFYTAQYAFNDLNRIILEDTKHSEKEDRFYCIGKINNDIVTVRFTYRNNKIRIFGAGYWRKWRKLYEKER
jgi:uncharacterized protein